jgi:hypothetical protein
MGKSISHRSRRQSENADSVFRGGNSQRGNLKTALANSGVFVALSKIDILQD